MCGIWYIRKYSKEYLEKSLQMQIDRWTDAYWYISDNWIIDKHPTAELDKEIFVDYCSNVTVATEWKRIAWHTRKSSVWVKDVANAHPHKIWDYVIMQNGTERKILDRAKLWYLSKFDDSKSDTHYLLSFILDKINWDHTTEKMTSILEELKNSSFCIWSTFVYDIQKDILYFISDWSRPSYVEIEDGKVVTISSKAICKEEQYKLETEHEYTNECVLAFKPSTWKILFGEEEITNTDKWLTHKPEKKSSFPNAYGYSWDRAGFCDDDDEDTRERRRSYKLSRKKNDNEPKRTITSTFSSHAAKKVCRYIQENILTDAPYDIADELVWQEISIKEVMIALFYLQSFINNWSEQFLIFLTNHKLFLDMFDYYKTSKDLSAFKTNLLEYINVIL